MASCKDCLSVDVCKNRDVFGDMPTCEHFKDRTRFVELPCNIGDTVYYFLNYSDFKKYEAVEVTGFHIDKYRTAFQIEICGFKMLVDIEFLGEKIFLIREEAERALNSSEKTNG